MSSSEKIFRDPLYNYVAVDKGRDRWLLDLIDTPEVQRLRRIHQLGVSHFTYPGADHSRLSHTLGVLHLMQHACRRLVKLEEGPGVELAQYVLLAAAVLHDVGHGPFSHLFEPALGIDHEDWSCEIITNPETAVYQTLVSHDIPIQHVTSLIEKDNHQRPAWQKTLLSSELDVDRLDYLRRDSDGNRVVVHIHLIRRLDQMAGVFVNAIENENVQTHGGIGYIGWLVRS